jgi:Domain of unknown function (DUF1707)
MDLERHDPGPAPGIRASDAERDRVVGLLKQHFTDGRLTLEEFSERMDVAYAAKTRGELVTTLRELPVLARTHAEAVEPRGHAHGHRHWAVPLPLIPLALVVLLVGVTVASRGLFLWPLFIFLWIWGGRHARHRHGHYHREWDRRGWHRHYHV